MNCASMFSVCDNIDDLSVCLSVLQDLQVTLNQLLEKLAPWAKIHLAPDHSIDQMIETLDNVAGEEGPTGGRVKVLPDSK